MHSFMSFRVLGLNMVVVKSRMSRTVPKLCHYICEAFETSWELLNCLVLQKTRLMLRLERRQTDSHILSIIKPGCNLNVQSSRGKTALHIAVSRSTTDVAEMLIKKGADVNIRDDDNTTPLHYAVKNDNLEMVCLLLYYGADINVLSNKYKLALVYALESDKFDIAEVLINYYDDKLNSLVDARKMSYKISDEILSEVICQSCNGCTHFQCYWNFEDAIFYSFYATGTERYNLMRMLHPFLIEYTDVEFCCCTDEEWLQFVYIVLEGLMTIETTRPLDNWGEIINAFSIDIYFFKNLFYSFYFRHIKENDRIALTYTCLSIGVPTQVYDISFVYQIYGFNEELEALLYGTTYFDEMRADEQFLFPLAYFILALDENYSNKFILELFERQMLCIYYGKVSPTITTTMLLYDTLRYFSLPYDAKQQLLAIWRRRRRSTVELATKLDQIPDMPTLIELARNQTRLFIKRSFNVKKPYQFHDAVKSLKLPPIIEDIIRFKTPIYFVK